MVCSNTTGPEVTLEGFDWIGELIGTVEQTCVETEFSPNLRLCRSGGFAFDFVAVCL